MDEIITNILCWLVAAFIVCLVCAFPTMWLWNWLMPVLFGFCKITVWQAIGINFLSAILFTRR